eukprot:SAG31_NODE_855_length_11461_cov_5.496215_13_plen_34_part_00
MSHVLIKITKFSTTFKGTSTNTYFEVLNLVGVE